MQRQPRSLARDVLTPQETLTEQQLADDPVIRRYMWRYVRQIDADEADRLMRERASQFGLSNAQIGHVLFEHMFAVINSEEQ